MDLHDLVNEIIPPSDYVHRNGFSNAHLIAKLNELEKLQVEDILLERLQLQGDIPDGLIIETLTAMGCLRQIPVLLELLSKVHDLDLKALIGSSIYLLNRDNNMFDIVSASIKSMKDPYALIFALNYLIPFKTEASKELLRSYLNHKDYLVQYNAKQVLERLEMG